MVYGCEEARQLFTDSAVVHRHIIVELRLIISSNLNSWYYNILGIIFAAQVLKSESFYSDRNCHISHGFIILCDS